MTQENENGRERLASRLGFILLSAGCAIGLGNVWRFPYIVGQNGGGWFVALYLVFLAIIGVPILAMEFTTGRAAQRSIATLHTVLTPEKRWWRLHGIAGTIGCVMLMMFYTTVTGWMVIYFLKMSGGTFSNLAPEQIGATFGNMLANPWQQCITMLGVVIAALMVCVMGLQKGLERVTKWMMLCLLALVVMLAINSVFLEGAKKGIQFYLVPDLGRIQKVGIVKVAVEAMNHAFFTLSLGIGSMAIFGSYITKRHTLLKEALNVASIDTMVALTAGLVIIPACFAFSLEPTQGPGLIFVTMPNVFNHMAGGRFWGALFFLFMSAAAFTTVLAVFECIIACFTDLTGYSRKRVCAILMFIIPLLSLPCILGFNVWSEFTPFGQSSNVLDLEDFIVSNILLPLGGLGFAIYCCHRSGWGWQNFLTEANAGNGIRIAGKVTMLYCRYLLPIIVVAVFVIGILAKFGILNFS